MNISKDLKLEFKKGQLMISYSFSDANDTEDASKAIVGVSAVAFKDSTGFLLNFFNKTHHGEVFNFVESRQLLGHAPEQQAISGADKKQTEKTLGSVVDGKVMMNAHEPKLSQGSKSRMTMHYSTDSSGKIKF